MRLSLKITLLLVAVIAGSVAANYVIQRVAVLPSFRALEHDDAIENWQRCANAIASDQNALSAQSFDWSSWDAPYTFMLGQNDTFSAENLENPDWFTSNGIDVMYFCKPDGTVYWKYVAEIEEGVPTKMAWLPGDRVPLDHPLMQVIESKDSVVDGLIHTEFGITMFSSRPILTSDYGGPMSGVLIFGRAITDETVMKLVDQTGVQFGVIDPAEPDLSASDRDTVNDASDADAPVELLIGQSKLSVSGFLMGIDDKPAILVQTHGERAISQHGASSLLFATWSLIVAGLLTLFALLIALRRMVIEPLDALTEHAQKIGKSGHFGEHLGLTRSDELGTLARSFDRMLDQLAEFRESTVTMSRQAGMAEVAAGVLHNVGNAMTNVGVLAETLGHKLGNSRVSSLSKVSTMLEEHRDDLPGFFGPGQQGEQVPEYVAQLSGRLAAENNEMRKDLSGLREGLDHIKMIVASHQGLAMSSNFSEDTDLVDIVTDSLHLIEASLRRHNVEACVQIQAPASVWGDRSKISQVLVNLLTNAKESLVSAGVPDPRVLVHLGLSDEGTAFVEVHDNGPGVAPEHVEQLFSKGFSTKSDGQGIGLHYCWLAVREMGGTLRFSPDESGTTVFRLELPVRAGAERTAA